MELNNNDYDKIVDDIEKNFKILTPHQLSNYCIQLSVWLVNIGDDLAEAEIKYNSVWAIERLAYDTDKQAEIKSKTTNEYFKKRKLELKLKALKELINAVKKRLMVLSDEGKNQY